MNVDKKVIAAISSAVGMYLQAEQESLAALQRQQAAGPPRPTYSPFMLAGRQAAMDVRWAWQMRMPR
jgi:hypothetical protein